MKYVTTLTEHNSYATQANIVSCYLDIILSAMSAHVSRPCDVAVNDSLSTAVTACYRYDSQVTRHLLTRWCSKLQPIFTRWRVSQWILTRRRFLSRTSKYPAVCLSLQTLLIVALVNTRHIAPEMTQCHRLIMHW